MLRDELVDFGRLRRIPTSNNCKGSTPLPESRLERRTALMIDEPQQGLRCQISFAMSKLPGKSCALARAAVLQRERLATPYNAAYQQSWSSCARSANFQA